MNILTFDIEEWFHILDNPSTKTIYQWKNYESRIYQNMDRIFNILEKSGAKATFFCLGWIAETYPEVIKDIIARGYEVGSHTRMHQLIYEQSPNNFEEDLERSIKTLEDISGKKVKYFRAPGFSITEGNKWVFEILIKYGIEVDSSIFPSARAHGGFPSYPHPFSSIISYNGLNIKELPINFVKVLGKPIIFSGGGYFRLFPYFFIKKWTKQTDYLMTYLHPRDFDPEQPVLANLSRLRKFKSYVGLKNSKKKFNKLLNDFEFVDIKTAVEMIDWNKVPEVKI